MSYSSIYANASDAAFTNRLMACVAQEGAENPAGASSSLVWAVVTHSDIEAAYASALAGSNPNPGGDETVITDQMILSAVQAELAAQTP